MRVFRVSWMVWVLCVLGVLFAHLGLLFLIGHSEGCQINRSLGLGIEQIF